MDELDRKIIELLQIDGRASNARIAREVGVSEGTVRRRLRHLIQNDVIKVLAVPNFGADGLRNGGPYRTAKQTLAKWTRWLTPWGALEEAHYVSITTGAYDIFAWVGLESPEKLGTFLRTRVGGHTRSQTDRDLCQPGDQETYLRPHSVGREQHKPANPSMASITMPLGFT